MARHLITGKNAAKFLINTVPGEEKLLYESLLKGELTVREVFGESRNVVLLVRPGTSFGCDYYFVIKQVQKEDAGKIQTLGYEANFLKTFYEKRFIDYDSESHILVYKTSNSLVSLDINKFNEGETFGYVLWDALRRFSLLSKPGKSFNSLGVKKKSFRILENWDLYKSQVKQNADLSVMECIAFIDKYKSVIDKIRNRWEKLSSGLVHGDARPGNFLMDTSTQKLEMIDFELSGTCNPVYDLSSFLFNSFRMVKVVYQNLLLPGVFTVNLKQVIVGLFKSFSTEYSDNIGYEDTVKDAFSFYYIQLIENYIDGTVKRSWNWRQQEMEYKSVVTYREIISEYDSIDCMQYIKK